MKSVAVRRGVMVPRRTSFYMVRSDLSGEFYVLQMACLPNFFLVSKRTERID